MKELKAIITTGRLFRQIKDPPLVCAAILSGLSCPSFWDLGLFHRYVTCPTSICHIVSSVHLNYPACALPHCSTLRFRSLDRHFFSGAGHQRDHVPSPRSPGTCGSGMGGNL